MMSAAADLDQIADEQNPTVPSKKIKDYFSQSIPLALIHKPDVFLTSDQPANR